MTAMPSFVHHVIGVMNFKPTMKFEYATVVMLFTVVLVMKWINAKIVLKLFALPVLHCLVVNFVVVVCVRTVLQHVGVVGLFCVAEMQSLL